MDHLFGGQATECSSSFGNTDSDDSIEATRAWDSSEVESAARDGNGALPSVLEDDAAGSSDRRRPLNMDWKNYRRRIEWRCRWLDLRLMQLRQQSSKYDQVLSKIQKEKKWESSDEPAVGAARIRPLPENRTQPSLLHRQRRRKMEDTVDVSTYMAKHPLFSRYEKKTRDTENLLVDGNQDLNLLNLSKVKQEKFDSGEEIAPVVDSGDQDSMEQILWRIESLQSRIIRMRNQLKAASTFRSSTQLPSHTRGGGVRTYSRMTSGLNSSKAAASVRPTRSTTATSSLAGGGGGLASPSLSKGALLRRRASDYDINNVVMPVNVGAKYVEHIRHVNIETPQWRLVDAASVSSGSAGDVGNGAINGGDVEDSSEEDSDDEVYRVRHESLEMKERQNRYIPRLNKRTAASTSEVMVDLTTLSKVTTTKSKPTNNLDTAGKLLRNATAAAAATTTTTSHTQCSISAQVNDID